MAIALEEFSLLIVEDEPFTCRVHVDMAAAIGVGTILSAASVAEAIHEIDQADEGVDAILLDIHMPEADGVEFLDDLIARDFQSPIIIVTGAHETLVKIVSGYGVANRLPISAVIRKPLTFDILKAMLTSLAAG